MSIQLTIPDGSPIEFITETHSTSTSDPYVVLQGTKGTLIRWTSIQPPIFQAYFVDSGRYHEFLIPDDKTATDFIRLDSEAARAAYDLERRLETRDAEVRFFQQERDRAREAHADDIEKIGDALNTEAADRGWCNEYQRFVENLNRSLSVELALPTREIQVRTTYTVTISETVQAQDYDDAVENGSDWESQISNQLRSLSGHVVVEYDRCEADDG
jgi:hypothetical protein